MLGTVVGGLLQRSLQTRLTGPQAAAMLSTDQQPGYGPTDTVTRPAPARRSRGRAVGLVAAGLVLGVVAALVGVYLLGSRSETVRFTYGEAGQIPLFEITSTGCVQGRIGAGRAVSSAASVSCDQPHDAEVFAALAPFDSYTAMRYPGERGLLDYGEKACALLFGSDRVTGSKTELEIVVLVPTEAQFIAMSSSGSSYPGREVMCALETRDGSQLTNPRLAKS